MNFEGGLKLQKYLSYSHQNIVNDNKVLHSDYFTQASKSEAVVIKNASHASMPGI